MENTINKYSTGKIYKITNNIDNICYVGSTIQYLHIRLSGHIQKYKLWLKDPIQYPFISSYKLFNIYGLKNCKIELIELYITFNRTELYKREGYYITLLNNVNMQTTGTTRK